MSNGRRYQDHEVREILDLAISREDASLPPLPARGGLTLGELQEIGQEVGMSPNRITEAVAAYESRGNTLPRTTAAGLPTSVGSIVALPRRPTDLEWERLIAELRTTFSGKGVVTSQGTLREWSSGTLHAFVEPTDTGYRLRMADSRAATLGVAVVFGGIFLAFATMIFVALLSKGDPGLRAIIPLLFGLVGGGVTAVTAMGLPGWAREQEKRMEHIRRYAVSLLAVPAPDDE